MGQLFYTLQLDRQKQLSKKIHVTQKDIRNRRTLNFNQHFIMSVSNLDENLVMTLYNYDKYSQDGNEKSRTCLNLLEFIGSASFSLNILEYYGNRETEKIFLKIKDGKGVSIAQLVVQFTFKTL